MVRSAALEKERSEAERVNVSLEIRFVRVRLPVVTMTNEYDSSVTEV
jgi:hypothetical protein